MNNSCSTKTVSETVPRNLERGKGELHRINQYTQKTLAVSDDSDGTSATRSVSGKKRTATNGRRREKIRGTGKKTNRNSEHGAQVREKFRPLPHEHPCGRKVTPGDLKRDRSSQEDSPLINKFGKRSSSGSQGVAPVKEGGRKHGGRNGRSRTS